jgi:asparagine N-glycosylation enzyme membrane subunit Stt3
MELRPSLALLAVLALAAALAWLPRSVEGLAHRYEPGGAAWFSIDPDGLYHARRVERAIVEGSVAETDPRIAFPGGAAIPWPPYYDAALAAALGPFAPHGEDERWRWVEHATASAPRILGVLAVLLVALASWRVGGVLAAAVAAPTVALCHASINYSVLGTGDHHAWIAMLAVALLGLASEALRPASLASRPRSAALGTAIGAVAGLMIGSWVAALLALLPVQLALGWMLFRRAREPLPGIGALGLAVHASCALVLLPAILSSPWRAELPWIVVNLSWFHLAYLAAGALAFVPLVALERSRLASGTAPARRYPFAVAAVLGAAALAAWALDLAPARGIAEGFAWVSRADRFMDAVLESRPLVGGRAESGVLFLALGYGVLALPFAWAFVARDAFVRRRDELVPWVVAAALLLPQALLQRRFADAFAAPMAVVLGLGAAKLALGGRRRSLAILAVALALLAQMPSARASWRRIQGGERERWVGSPIDAVNGERRALEWIRARSDGSDAWSVLAHWDRGHAIEFVARAPSVATNFGSYVGLESYRDPPAYFLDELPSRARAILERRRVRYVLVPATIVTVVPSMCRVVDPSLAQRYVAPAPGGGSTLKPEWYATVGGRLLVGGVPLAPDGALVGEETGPIDHLRLVHVSRERNSRVLDPITGLPFPAAAVWEHVAGAVVEARGTPGERLELELDVAFEGARYRLPWRASAVAGPGGVARVRLPYSTVEPNGDGVPQSARWRFRGREGELLVPESAVLEGSTVPVAP